MENTPRNFALQLGSLITLYISISALIMLLLGVITVQYPDPAQGYYEYDAAASGIRFGIALLVVFFPSYLVLTRIVNNLRRRELGTYLGLTRWLIYLSLVIGGATLLGDLVAVVNSFLNGELTMRFVLKALVFLVVVGAAFIYYLMDARGYWQSHEKHSLWFGAGVVVVVLVALFLGFSRIETPAAVHEMKLDSQEVNDLTNIQSNIEQYYVLNGKLPVKLDVAFTTGIAVPTAPQGRDPYTYEVTDVNSFKLCATFVHPTSKAEQLQYAQPVPAGVDTIKNPYNWNHGIGKQCFERVVTPQQSKSTGA